MTQRLLTSKQAMPGFIRRLFGTSRDEGEVAYALEISELDPRKKTYTARSVNLNWNHLVKVDESIELHEDPEDVMKTKMNQRVEITCSLSKMSRLVEDALGGFWSLANCNGPDLTP